MTVRPANDFFIQPLEVSETRLLYDVLLAPRPNPGFDFEARRKLPITVDMAATLPGGEEVPFEVKLEPVGLDCKLRELDLWEEYREATAPDALTGYVVPDYEWWKEWPSGKARITHLAGRQELPWRLARGNEVRLARGDEVRIHFPVPKSGQVEAMRAEDRRQLVLYVEAPTVGPPEDRQAPADLPLRTSETIQGNVLAGFNKDHQVFLFLFFNDQEQAREWVSQLTPEGESRDHRAEGKITMTAEVTEFKDKLRKGREEKDPEAEYIQAVWSNLSFTFAGIQLLQPKLAAELERRKLFEEFRQGAAQREIFRKLEESDPKRWVLTETVHALLTIAADDPDVLARAVTEQLERAASCDVVVRYRQRGDALPKPLQGREHFGFKDGISQPGVEGYTRPAKGSDGKQDADHPGSRIVAPKHFLLDADAPDWMREGTFQAFARLCQDVARWSTQVRYQSQNMPVNDLMSQELLAAKLIGRWPSGTPISLAPRRDDRPEESAGDNQFTFANDPFGVRCPRFAHIRTQNPRDGAADDEHLADDEHRILRRGIPFGPAYDPAEAEGGYGQSDNQERGMCFNAFMTSIKEQYEFLLDKVIDEAPDPVIDAREASFDLRLPDGPDPEDPMVRPLGLRGYVATTLALYAFAPSLGGLQKLANRGTDS